MLRFIFRDSLLHIFMSTSSNLDIVLNKLYLATKDTAPSKSVECRIECSSQNVEDLGENIETLDFLIKEKIIESYEKYSQGQEEIEVDFANDSLSHEIVYFLKFDCRLKPKKVTDFMIDSSRLPKYSLRLGPGREIILNDCYILSTPQFTSSNHYFIEYALKHPNEIIKKADVEIKAGKIKKRFHTVLEQIIKSPDLRQVFFPDVSKDAAKFRNSVTVNDMLGEKINERKIADFLKTLMKVKTL